MCRTIRVELAKRSQGHKATPGQYMGTSQNNANVTRLFQKASEASSIGDPCNSSPHYSPYHKYSIYIYIYICNLYG